MLMKEKKRSLTINEEQTGAKTQLFMCSFAQTLTIQLHFNI